MGKYRILVKGIVQFENKYLIVQKWYDDRIVDPYQWEFLDGEMEFNETPEKAVERIVENKIGVPAKVSKTLYTWGFTAGETCNIGIAFICDSPTETVNLSEDLHDYKWVEKTDLSEFISNKAMLDDLDRAGFTENFTLDDFGKVDLFIEPLD